MDFEKEIKDLRSVVDALLIQESWLTSRTRVLFDLAMYYPKDFLTEDQYNLYFTNFVDKLEKWSKKSAERLENSLYKPQEAFSYSSDESLYIKLVLKESPHYLSHEDYEAIWKKVYGDGSACPESGD